MSISPLPEPDERYDQRHQRVRSNEVALAKNLEARPKGPSEHGPDAEEQSRRPYTEMEEPQLTFRAYSLLVVCPVYFFKVSFGNGVLMPKEYGT
jgi:hypothetical protein